MLDDLLAPEAGRRLIAWFYTPMALEFAGHLVPDVTVYDCMDELSNFKFAPPELRERERELMARADAVFTGGYSPDPDFPAITWSEEQFGRGLFYYENVVSQRFLRFHT